MCYVYVFCIGSMYHKQKYTIGTNLFHYCSHFFYVLNKYSVIKCALDIKITRKKINIDYQTRLKCHGKVSGLILKQTLWDGVVTVSISQSYQAQTKSRGKHHYEKKQSKVIKLHRPLSTCMFACSWNLHFYCLLLG